MSLSSSNGSSLQYQDYSILLVDDTPNNLDVLIEFLEEYGFNLRVALSGESALQRIRYDAPDIVLLDVLLPGIDGFETCRQLKADPATRDIPIIFMTSLASAEDKVRGFEVGAVDYVTKPLQQSEVLARITTHLRQRDSAQELAAQHQQLLQSSQVERQRLLDAVAEQRDQLRTLSANLTDVQEDERRRLSRELHDEMGQSLTALCINLAAIDKEILNSDLPPATSQNIHNRVSESVQITNETLDQIRKISADLRPATLDDLGLVPTLRWYVGRFTNRTNIPVTVDEAGVETGPRLHSTIETALYRMIQEALTNISRHADATHVALTLTATPTGVSTKITDNGSGFDPAAGQLEYRTTKGIGLLGMTERAKLLGGSCYIDSAIGRGTSIDIFLPRNLEQLT